MNHQQSEVAKADGKQVFSFGVSLFLKANGPEYVETLKEGHSRWSAHPRLEFVETWEVGCKFFLFPPVNLREVFSKTLPDLPLPQTEVLPAVSELLMVLSRHRELGWEEAVDSQSLIQEKSLRLYLQAPDSLHEFLEGEYKEMLRGPLSLYIRSDEEKHRLQELLTDSSLLWAS